MQTEYEINAIVHIGSIRNIDLTCRGIYYISLSLSKGQKNANICPNDYFSSPSGLHSYVKERKIAEARLINSCEITESDNIFKSRTFVIRFRDEIHELNEACNFNFEHKINNDEKLPIVDESLQIHFELMCAPLENKDDSSYFTDLESLYPENPVFKQVASQTLFVKSLNTGLHEYFPVRFERGNSMEVDAMIHIGVTAMKFHPASLLTHLTTSSSGSITQDLPIIIYPKSSDHATSNSSLAPPTTLPDESNPSLPISETSSHILTTPKKHSSARAPMKTHSPASFNAAALTTASSIPVATPPSYRSNVNYDTTTTSNNSHPLTNPSTTTTNTTTSDSGLLLTPKIHPPDRYCDSHILRWIKEDWSSTEIQISFKLLDQLSSTNIMNTNNYSHTTILKTIHLYYRIASTLCNHLTLLIIAVKSNLNVLNSLSSNKLLKSKLDLLDNFIVSLTTSMNENEIENSSNNSSNNNSYSGDTIFKQLLKISSEKTAVTLLQSLINQSNELSTAVWREFFICLSKHMIAVRDSLRSDYLLRVRLFWKRLMIVQTCRSADVKRPHAGETFALSQLLAHIKLEASDLTTTATASASGGSGGGGGGGGWVGGGVGGFAVSEAERKTYRYAAGGVGSEERESCLPVPVGGYDWELRVTDLNTHRCIERLPVLLLQQYQSPQSALRLRLLQAASSSSTTTAASSSSSTFTLSGVHVHTPETAQMMVEKWSRGGLLLGCRDVAELLSDCCSDASETCGAVEARNGSPLQKMKKLITQPASPLNWRKGRNRLWTSAVLTAAGKSHQPSNAEQQQQQQQQQQVSVSQSVLNHPRPSHQVNTSAATTTTTTTATKSVTGLHLPLSLCRSNTPEPEDASANDGLTTPAAAAARFRLHEGSDMEASSDLDNMSDGNIDIDMSAIHLTSDDTDFPYDKDSDEEDASYPDTDTAAGLSGRSSLIKEFESIDVAQQQRGLPSPEPSLPPVTAKEGDYPHRPSPVDDDATKASEEPPVEPNSLPHYVSDSQSLIDSSEFPADRSHVMLATATTTTTTGPASSENSRQWGHSLGSRPAFRVPNRVGISQSRLNNVSDSINAGRSSPAPLAPAALLPPASPLPAISRSNPGAVQQYLDQTGSTKHPMSGLVLVEGPDSVSCATAHLIVLCHGFQGNSMDMRLLANMVTAEFPHYHVLVSRANESDSESLLLSEMGARLAKELVVYCSDKLPSLLHTSNQIMGEGRNSRISFIGHSLGGLIIRSCLQEPEMAGVLGHLHTFITLATPHLGTLYADSQLVATGMWALFKLRRCPVLQELSLGDLSEGDPLNCYLFRLSESSVLQGFRWVVLVTSPRDQYVPEYSARMQISQRAVTDPSTGHVIVRMTANLMSQIDPERLVRVTVENNVGGAMNVDSMIGRTAHICYLDNPVVAEQLFYSLYSYFL